MALTRLATTLSKPKTSGKTRPFGVNADRLDGAAMREFKGTQAPTPAPAAGGSLYRSGGGGAAAGMAAAAPRMTFDQFLSGNPLYAMAMNENSRQLQDFDAETLRMTQETEAQQGLQRAALQRALASMANQGQGDLNARGIGRSGLAFQQQDEVNQYGVQQGNVIDQLLTSLLGQRTSGRIGVETQGRQAQNSLVERLLNQFNGGQAIG